MVITYFRVNPHTHSFDDDCSEDDNFEDHDNDDPDNYNHGAGNEMGMLLMTMIIIMIMMVGMMMIVMMIDDDDYIGDLEIVDISNERNAQIVN